MQVVLWISGLHLEGLQSRVADQRLDCIAGYKEAVTMNETARRVAAAVDRCYRKSPKTKNNKISVKENLFLYFYKAITNAEWKFVWSFILHIAFKRSINWIKLLMASARERSWVYRGNVGGKSLWLTWGSNPIISISSAPIQKKFIINWITREKRRIGMKDYVNTVSWAKRDRL